MNEKIYRILDANFNRVKEGLRVLEEYFRFVLNDKDNIEKLKQLRHDISDIIFNQNILCDLIKNRDVVNDKIAYDYTDTESCRREVKDVLYANFQRVKEAVRVLEEYGKVIDKNLGQNFQKIRFSIYKLEKEIVLKNKEAVNKK